MTTELSEIRICQTCGTRFEIENLEFRIGGRTCPFPPKLHCDPCCDVYMARVRSNSGAPADSRPEWESFCPRAYQGFRLDLLPERSRFVAELVLSWKWSARGIGLSGESRTGKTFILTELMRRQFEAGRSVWMPTASEFAYSVGSGHDGDRREMIGKCIATDCLLLDDIGNARYTDRVEKDLFHVLETRRRNLRPVFVTINGKGADLAAGLSEQSAKPIVNRLREDVCRFYSI